MSAPVTVMRPSGKMTQCLSFSTSRISARVESGLVGSMGKASIRARKGLTHQRVAMWVSMANMGRPGRKAASSGPSRKEAWLTTTTARGPAFSMFSRPLTSTR